MFDVLIAGGGPAGAVTGYCLSRRGARVALLEATGYESERLGETVPPEIQPVLRELGLWEAFTCLAPLESPGVVSQWGDGEAAEVDFVGNPHGPGWHLDRQAFDAMLLREAGRAGTRVLLNRRLDGARRVNGAWEFEGVRGSVLVDATGRNGLRLEPHAGREIDDVLLAITLLVSYDRGEPVDRRTYIETAPCGWWYSTLLPDGRVMAMFFTDRETYGEGIRMGDHLVEAPWTAARLRHGRIERSRVVYAPSSCRRSMSGDGWVAVGDSASCYDPLSGRGIFKALRQGSTAAEVLAGSGEGGTFDGYARTVRREFDAYVRQRRLYYGLERRWAEHGFWQRREGKAGPAGTRL